MTDRMLILSILLMAGITVLLRAIPFLLLKGKKTPEWLSPLGKVLSYAVIGMLVVYCLKGLSFSAPGGFLPEVIAVVIVVVSYIWKKNTLLSIVSGTVVYMLLVQNVF